MAKLVSMTTTEGVEMLIISLKTGVIHTVLKQHNLSHEGLAAALGITPDRLTRLAQGEAISQDLLARLAAISGTTLDDLASVTTVKTAA